MFLANNRALRKESISIKRKSLQNHDYSYECKFNDLLICEEVRKDMSQSLSINNAEFNNVISDARSWQPC